MSKAVAECIESRPPVYRVDVDLPLIVPNVTLALRFVPGQLIQDPYMLALCKKYKVPLQATSG